MGLGNVADQSAQRVVWRYRDRPKGATHRDPKTGDISTKNSWIADVIVDRTIQGYETARTIAMWPCSSRMRTTSLKRLHALRAKNTAGLTAVNYRAEPYKFREASGCSLGKVFQPCSVDKPESIATPDHRSACGRSRIHVFGASNEQNGMFSVENMNGRSSRSCAAPTRSASWSSRRQNRWMPSSKRQAEASVSRAIMCGAISVAHAQSGSMGSLKVLPNR